MSRIELMEKLAAAMEADEELNPTTRLALLGFLWAMTQGADYRDCGEIEHGVADFRERTGLSPKQELKLRRLLVEYMGGTERQVMRGEGRGSRLTVELTEAENPSDEVTTRCPIGTPGQREKVPHRYPPIYSEEFKKGNRPLTGAVLSDSGPTATTRTGAERAASRALSRMERACGNRVRHPGLRRELIDQLSALHLHVLNAVERAFVSARHVMADGGYLGLPGTRAIPQSPAILLNGGLEELLVYLEEDGEIQTRPERFSQQWPRGNDDPGEEGR